MERGTGQNEACDEEWVVIPPESIDGIAPGALSERQVRRWALVLDARRVRCRIEPGEKGWQLLVPAGLLPAAREELNLFEIENRSWPPPEPPATPLAQNILATLSVLILLATFHNLTQLDMNVMGHRPVDWTALGNAHVSAILHGEWWRLVTALTLHGDWLHLFSNLALGGVFIVWVCRDLGSGLGWGLLLASGILGNLANVSLQPHYHRSVGSSTLLFGAVGILAAVNLVRYRHQRHRRWPLPVAAALALLALLGTEGKNTDLGAHLFGFAFGTGLGLAAEYLLERHGRVGRRLNALLVLACALTVAGAWWAALVFGKST